jgi:hypothetical protein
MEAAKDQNWAVEPQGKKILIEKVNCAECCGIMVVNYLKTVTKLPSEDICSNSVTI